MAKTRQQIKQEIQNNLPTNGQNRISAADVRGILNDIADLIGAGFVFMGVATPSTDPGMPDQNVFYIGGAGTYANFGSSVTVPDGSIGVFLYDNSAWNCNQIAIGGGGSYVLPPATAQTLGGVKIGAGINVAPDGTISVNGGGGIPAVVVEPNGRGNYRTIQEAINATQTGATILIMPGVYEEAIEMFGRERYLIGFCKEKCILTNGTGNYDTPPLEASIGGVYNMTIIADNYNPTISDPTTSHDRPSYGIHIEDSNSSAYSFTVQNCKVVSKWSAAIGAGVRYNQTINIIDCELISNCVKQWSIWKSDYVEMGGLFFHNDAASTTALGTGIINVENTILKGETATLTIESLDNSIPMVSAKFINCNFYSNKYHQGLLGIYRFNDDTQNGSLCGSRIFVDITSRGNNYKNLNGVDIVTPSVIKLYDLAPQGGYYVYDSSNNTLSFTQSPNWVYRVFPIEIIDCVSVMIASLDWSITTASNIVIAFLDGNDPLTANILGVKHAVNGSYWTADGISRGIGVTSNQLEVPDGTTHVLIQNNHFLYPDAEIVFKNAPVIPVRPTRVDNIVNTFTDTGFWEYDNSLQTATLNASQNWIYKVFAKDVIKETNAALASSDWDTPGLTSRNIPLIYLDGADPTQANIVGVQYGATQTIPPNYPRGLGFVQDPLSWPVGATHILVQSNIVLGPDQTVTVYTDVN